MKREGPRPRRAGDSFDKTAIRGPGFVDPTPGLKAEYAAALERMKAELGEPRTLRERIRFRRRAYALGARMFAARGTVNW